MYSSDEMFERFVESVVNDCYGKQRRFKSSLFEFLLTQF